ncbi:MAG: cytochrome c [Thermaerobacterales bacterium]
MGPYDSGTCNDKFRERPALPGIVWILFSGAALLLSGYVVLFWTPQLPPGRDEGPVQAEDREAQLTRIRDTVPDDARTDTIPVTVTEESLARARTIYNNRCAVCHGPDGNADIPAARAMEPPPVDFTEPSFAAMEPGVSYHVIAHGVEGTAMPGFRQSISEDDRWQLVAFLRQVFAEVPAGAAD